MPARPLPARPSPTRPSIAADAPPGETASLQPRCFADLLDYRLYLTYRECGYITEQLLQSGFGINRRRWRILASVYEHEGATLNTLAQHAELDKVQASRTVGTMVREGYLKRLSNPANARFASIVLSDKGRDLYDAIWAQYKATNAAMVNMLSATEAQQLDVLLAKVRQGAVLQRASGAGD